MQNFSPLVSIVIPVYNGADYVKEAIESALGQTYPNIEIIVVNDGSRDEGATARVAQEYGTAIRYFEKENGGVATALNMGIREMKGAYFSWLSHDDRYYPQKIQNQIDNLIRLQEEDLVLYSDYDIINEKSEVIETIHGPHIEPADFYRWIIRESLLHGCSLLVPARCFAECGTFNTDLWTTQDYDLWLRIAEKFKFVHSPEVLISSRVHGKQTSRTMPEKSLVECNQLYDKVLKNLAPEILNDTSYMMSLIDNYYDKGFYMACITAIKLLKQKKPGLSTQMYLRKKRAKAMIHILKKQRFLLKYMDNA